jgi:hypothetical protein
VDTVQLYNAAATMMPLRVTSTPTICSCSQDEVTDTLINAAVEAYEERERSLVKKWCEPGSDVCCWSR